MELDPTRCYRALKTRDARFDGRFFVGVVTTGIYCRPICPARTPLRRNIRFFASAAAAGEGGFRPCLRCRPESAAGTPAWLGTSTTVGRGLELISAGALDTGSVEDLAARLGIGERHLRRLFREHVGANPIAVAQTRRLHFAKKCIDETPLSMTEIASAAGYASLRRFNSAVRTAYGVPPGELRRRCSRSKRVGASRAGSAGGDSDVLELKLAYRPPIALAALFAFLATRAIPGVEAVTKGSYARSISIDNVSAVIEIQAVAKEDTLRVRVPSGLSRHLTHVVSRVRRIFDLDADPVEIRSQLASDTLLAAPLKRFRGLRVPGAWDGFELAVRAILGQQVSLAGATTLAGRLVDTFGEPLSQPHPGIHHLFPSPQRLADSDVAGIGLPRRRADAISALARAVAEDGLDLELGSDLEATRAQLLALPGIGPWTADYIAMRALREPDAFPAGDLVLRKVASPDPHPLSEKALDERSQAWRPWRAYAVIALWKLGESRD